MATIVVASGGPNTANLSTAQTGNGTSTNTVDRGGRTDAPVAVKIVTTVGATPTCTYALEGSPDGSAWFSVPYSELATPETVAISTFAITTATTTWKFLRPNHPWRFFRLSYTSNTNVTNTVDVWVF